MYLPANVPDKPDQLPQFLRDELQRISLASVEGLVYLKPLNVEPKKRSDGMVVKADGTNWNPGSGEGVYAYYAGVWTKLASGSGPTGPAGAAGSAGAALFMLDDGPEPDFQMPGPTGPQGTAGTNGGTGPQGAQGAAIFLAAEDGLDGETGPPGARGADGAAGTTGAQGIPGLVGAALFMLADTAEPEMSWLGPVGPPLPDPHSGSYTPGSFAVETGKYAVLSRHLIMTTTQRATLSGTATLRIT